MTRTVTVALRAINTQFDSSYAKSSAAARGLGDEVSKTAAKHKTAMSTIGRDAMVAGGLMVAGFAMTVRAAADFEARMSLVRTLSGATSLEMNKLSKAALTMGQGIGFSAGQVADAETELVKAGISVSDILGGALKGSLALAAAGQLDVAQATEIATVAMTQFKLHGSDIPHVADLLAAGADKALGSVGDLGEALKSGGLVASQFGVNIETTIGVLASFAQSGLMGEAAGTDLRQMLLKLAAPGQEAADEMRKLGISIYDTSGHFVGMVGLAGQLHDKLGKLDESTRNAALATIFGARAIVGANILYNEGAKGLQAWIDNIDATGFAMHQASGKMDNLKGDVSKLGAAFQADLIQGGTGANGVLREMTQGATGLLKAYGALPSSLQGGATALLGVAGAITLLGGAALVAVPKIAAMDAALLEMTDGAVGARTALSGLGYAAGGLAAVGATLFGLYTAADAIGNHFVSSSPKVNALTDSLVDLARTGKQSGEFLKTFSGNIGDFHTQLKQAVDPSTWEKIENFGNRLQPWRSFTGNGIEQSKQNIKALDESLARLVQSGNGDVAAMALKNLGVSATDAAKQLPQYAEALAGADVSGKLAGTSADLLTGKISAQSAAAAASVSSLSAYAKALNLSKDEIKALSDQVTEWSKSFAGFSAPLKTYTDLLGEKQAAEKRAAEATAKSTKSSKDSWKDYVHSVGVSIDEYEGRLAKQVAAQQSWGRNMLILSSRVSATTLDALARMGKDGAPLVAQLVNASGKQLAKLDTLFAQGASNATDAMATRLELAQPVLTAVAAKLGQATATKLAKELAAGQTTVAAIAAQYGIDLGSGVRAGTSQAIGGVNALNRALASLPRNVTIGIELSAHQTSLHAAETQLGIPHKAAGGLLRGAGTGTSDSIPILASNGEFVVNAHATSKHLGLLRALNAEKFASGGVVGYNPKAGTLTAQSTAIVRRGGSSDDVQALISAYEAYLNKLDQVRQREDLLDQLRKTRAAAAKARGADVAGAQQSVSDAIKALNDFDRQAGIDAQKAATDALLAKLQRSKELLAQRYEIEDNLYTLGKKSAASEIASLTKRMSAEKKYSDAWMQLYNQRKQVEDDEAQRRKDDLAAAYTIADNMYALGLRNDATEIASLNKRMAAEVKYSDAWMSLYNQRQAILDKQAEAAKQQADDAKQAYDDALSTLNGYLDQVDELHKEQLSSQQAFAAKQTDLLKQQAAAEDTLHTGMAKAAADLATRTAQLVAARAKALNDSVADDAQITRSWGSSVSWLTGNVTSQIAKFQEWTAQLADARRRGVSEAVIGALGLDKGPEALDQLHQFSNATQAQIDALNAAVAAKMAAAQQQAGIEQVTGAGQLGGDLASAQSDYLATVTQLQQDYQSSMADLSQQLSDAQDAFAAEQADYAKQLAAIGQSQGRSYADALAAGLASGIPGVLAAAQALQNAAQGVSTTTGPASAPGGLANDNGTNPYASVEAMGGQVLGNNAYSLDLTSGVPIFSQAGKSYTAAQITAMFKAQYGYTYDEGGWLMPGDVGINLSGKPEPVFSSAQWETLQNGGGSGDVQVRVFIGEQELTGIVRTEVEQAGAARKTANAIAGRR